MIQRKTQPLPTSILAGPLIAAGFLGCATTSASRALPPSTAQAKPQDAQSAFLWLRTIDGFDAIDDEHVVVHSGNKHALVTMFGYCDGLRYAGQIAIEAPLGYLDRSALGTIIYRQFPGFARRCPIDRIVAVADLKEARDRAAAEKAQKAKQKPPS